MDEVFERLGDLTGNDILALAGAVLFLGGAFIATCGGRGGPRWGTVICGSLSCAAGGIALVVAIATW